MNPPVHALVNEPSFSLTVPVSEDDARRYATALWLIQEKASRYFGTASKTLPPREYKRLMGEIYSECRAALGLRA